MLLSKSLHTRWPDIHCAGTLNIAICLIEFLPSKKTQQRQVSQAELATEMTKFVISWHLIGHSYTHDSHKWARWYIISGQEAGLVRSGHLGAQGNELRPQGVPGGEFRPALGLVLGHPASRRAALRLRVGHPGRELAQGLPGDPEDPLQEQVAVAWDPPRPKGGQFALPSRLHNLLMVGEQHDPREAALVAGDEGFHRALGVVDGADDCALGRGEQLNGVLEQLLRSSRRLHFEDAVPDSNALCVANKITEINY